VKRTSAVAELCPLGKVEKGHLLRGSELCADLLIELVALTAYALA
jgi:hypothetical protein